MFIGRWVGVVFLIHLLLQKSDGFEDVIMFESMLNYWISLDKLRKKDII